MKFLNEYRDPDLVEQFLEQIHLVAEGEWKIMEFCGGQTHSLVKNGIVNLLPNNIKMVHGPGCPVCVTPLNLIDQAIELSFHKNVILCSFGDMLRVPGSRKTLLEARAEGADIRFLYSPLEAVKLAEQNLDKEVVFFAVGFETTAPANALSVLHAQQFGLKNYSILSSHVLVPPAIRTVLEEADNQIHGFLGAGNVCSVMGLSEYQAIVDDYQVPLVVTGFEPIDLLQGILMTIEQLEQGTHRLENQYSRVVPKEGNTVARSIINQVFEVTDRAWRGIGVLPNSGWKVRKAFANFDANEKFKLQTNSIHEETECIAGEVLKGNKKPKDCPHFGKKCTPLNPLGAPMVSSEGACAAYYHFSLAEVDYS